MFSCSGLQVVRYRWRICLFFVMLLFVGYGCQITEAPSGLEGESEMTIILTSAAFREGADIPRKYTCDGEDLSPPLSWSGIPQDALSLALIADDPDAPVGTWVHWVLYDIPPDREGLSAGVQGVGTEGVNDFRRFGYGGPCPPKGKPHRYFFKLYALDIELKLPAGATKEQVEQAMQGHILAQGQLMGKYSR